MIMANLNSLGHDEFKAELCIWSIVRPVKWNWIEIVQKLDQKTEEKLNCNEIFLKRTE